MDNKVVIDGEAPETDSEDELKSDIESVCNYLRH